jgi:hypothetical protein
MEINPVSKTITKGKVKEVNLVKMTGVYIFSIYLPLDLNTSISLKLN